MAVGVSVQAEGSRGGRAGIGGLRPRWGAGGRRNREFHWVIGGGLEKAERGRRFAQYMSLLTAAYKVIN